MLDSRARKKKLKGVWGRACGSFLSEWVRGSLETYVQDSGVSTHGGGDPKKDACQIFAFMLNREVFFFPFPFIQSSPTYMSSFKLTSTPLEWDSEGSSVWFKVTELVSKDTRLLF